MRRLRLLFALATMALLLAYFSLMFSAGREGDAKSGLGNPVGSLHLEATAGSVLLGSLASAVGYISLRLGRVGDRLKYGIALFVFGGLLLWILGIYIEECGIRPQPVLRIPQLTFERTRRE
jgi:hypothetical protein